MFEKIHASTIDKYMKYKRIFGFYDENYKGKIIKQHFKREAFKKKKNKIKNLIGPPNGCFSVTESMSVTYIQVENTSPPLCTKDIFWFWLNFNALSTILHLHNFIFQLPNKL